MKITKLLSKAGLNGFFLLLIATVIAAWLYPKAGTESGPLPLRTISNIGVSVIFFFYGLKLSPDKLRSGLGQIRVHLLIQSATFLIFPAVVLVGYGFFYDSQFEQWWIGVFYVAALPSTVSSSVVMVSIAGGNIAAAIFNASISSLLGIVLTPVWMSILVKNSSFAAGGLSSVILNLCVQILLPVVAGLLLHRKLGDLTDRYKKGLRNFDQFIILVIVYKAFCDSFDNGLFSGYSAVELITLSCIMLALFFVLFTLMSALSGLMKISREDRIAVIFCGSKKSLVQGAVMGQVLFPQNPSLGIILLPLIIYHALQLLAGSVIAQRMARTS